MQPKQRLLFLTAVWITFATKRSCVAHSCWWEMQRGIHTFASRQRRYPLPTWVNIGAVNFVQSWETARDQATVAMTHVQTYVCIHRSFTTAQTQETWSAIQTLPHSNPSDTSLDSTSSHETNYGLRLPGCLRQLKTRTIDYVSCGRCWALACHPSMYQIDFLRQPICFSVCLRVVGCYFESHLCFLLMVPNEANYRGCDENTDRLLLRGASDGTRILKHAYLRARLDYSSTQQCVRCIAITVCFWLHCCVHQWRRPGFFGTPRTFV